MKCFMGIALTCLILASCKPVPPEVASLQQLCPNYNPVFVQHIGNDSAMFWIPNCFAPGDSTSPNDSLVEYERNMAQVIVTIIDSIDSIPMAYSNQTFQNPGFASRTVWYGNYGYNLVAPEKCYNLKVTGTTLWGTTFTMYGSVSLMRYFFNNDTTGSNYEKIYAHCDTCTFNTQWSGSNVNLQLPTHETFVQDAYHQCN